MTFEEARAEFPVLERLAYLNAGSMGPLARATGEAMAEQVRTDVQAGRAGGAYFERMLELRGSVRERLAGFLSVAPERMALTSSTTDGCNIVLSGLELDPEDEIVTTDAEHPGLLGPLAVSGARVVVAPVATRPAAEAVDVIRAAITPRTRLVAISHVVWTTGQVIPVDEVKEATGLPVLVDGAQSVGAIQVEAGTVDFYTVSCQKWLCGPDPLGGLYVADPEGLRLTSPTYFSQQSMEVDGSFVPKDGALRFDAGWLAVPSLAGLVAALDLAPEWRFDRARELAERCRDRLAEAGFEVRTEPGQAGLVTFEPRNGEPDAAAARALEAGVVIRALPKTPWIRASCGYWTSDEDVDRLVAALA
ncbi:MAG TPA: aminotransferase class V-fold PLP-dependent enzyme [Gaiellaceae bacterium]